MATKQLQTNLKVIQSGTVPTPATLPEGCLAFGEVGGEPKLYGNAGAGVVEYGGGGGGGGLSLIWEGNAYGDEDPVVPENTLQGGKRYLFEINATIYPGSFEFVVFATVGSGQIDLSRALMAGTGTGILFFGELYLSSGYWTTRGSTAIGFEDTGAGVDVYMSANDWELTKIWEVT